MTELSLQVDSMEMAKQKAEFDLTMAMKDKNKLKESQVNLEAEIKILRDKEFTLSQAYDELSGNYNFVERESSRLKTELMQEI